MKNLSIIILSAIFLYSCDGLETVIDLDIPEHNPVLVLNSSINADSNIRVFVSHSIDAFGNAYPISIDDATVLLYEDNQFIDTLLPDFTDPKYYTYFTSDGFNSREDSILIHYYKSDFITQANKTYRLEVSHPMYPSVSSSTTTPSGVELNLLESNNPAGIEFSFNDDPSKENFYRLRVLAHFSYESDGQIKSFTERIEFRSNDLSFPGDVPFDGFSFYGYRAIFEDALFNGSEKQISIELVGAEEYLEEVDSIYIHFSELSSDAYSYINSRDSQVNGGQAGIFGGEVTPVFSNVENGLGIFRSLNSQTVTVRNNLTE
ncbi:DUF4249 domain-containing protein [Flavobacteriales bacterium]|nr:DUF4249 domain-containing protein [Flavobacteriales bacterium]